MVHFRDPWDAHIFHGRLEAEGVPAFVTDDTLISMRWYLSTAFGGVRVQVPNDYAAAAAAVLADAEAGLYEAELANEFGNIDKLRCPHCGSADVRRRPGPLEVLFSLVLVLFGLVGKVVADRCTCRACGTHWKDRRYG